MSFASATQRYSARPPAPVRNVPCGPVVVPTAVPLAATRVAVALLLAVEPAAAPVDAAVLGDELEPHAATSKLTPISAVTAPIRYLILRSLCIFTPDAWLI